MNCEISGDKSKANLTDLDDGKTHSVAVKTSKGDFTFDLATKTSPCTTAVVRRPRRQGLLRRPDLPPDRARAS